jgi:hypothetical protein
VKIVENTPMDEEVERLTISQTVRLESLKAAVKRTKGLTTNHILILDEAKKYEDWIMEGSSDLGEFKTEDPNVVS